MGRGGVGGDDHDGQHSTYLGSVSMCFKHFGAALIGDRKRVMIAFEMLCSEL